MLRTDEAVAARGRAAAVRRPARPACATTLLLELRRALGRAARPFAQALELARLGEVEEGEDGRGRRRREPA